MTKLEIALLVAAKYGLTIDELKSRTHAWRVSHPRQEAFALCYAQRSADRRHTDPCTLPAIGKFFGGRDHTTVLWGIRAHEARKAAVQ